MATSHQTISLLGMQLEAKFQHTPSLVFFVVANVLACAYSLLVLIVPPASPAARFSFGFCALQMAGMVLTGAVAAAGAISDLGKNGNDHAGWLPICGLVHTFCDHVKGGSHLRPVILCFFLLYSTLTSPLLPQ
nr:unnamed protein product [Digitaria exilis]